MTDEGNRVPIQPVPEHETGTVFAGRGQEQHGVPMTGTPDLSDMWQGADPVLVHEEPPPPDPIPVRIIRDGGHEYVKGRTQRAYAGDQTSQVVGRDMTRNVVRVRNLSSTPADRVWLGFAPHLANAAQGYPLDPGAEFVSNAEQELYCGRDGASPTNPIPVAVYVEHVVTES